MAAINPTENTALIVDEFIRYATAHLKTVQGTINTNSLYQVGPATQVLPGLINWTGYTVDPAKPTKVMAIDDLPNQDSLEDQGSKPVTKDESDIYDGTTEEDMDLKLLLERDRTARAVAEGTPTINTGDIVETPKWSTGKPFVSGFKGGGFSAGFTGGVNVDLGEINLNADWITLAAQFIAKNERFTERATWDYNAYRLGFGSDKIIGSDGKIRDVLPTPEYYRQTKEKTPANGDITTVDAALKMLQYEVSVSYKNRLVGSKSYQITQATFDRLNNRQKAALISYVYNVGSLYESTAKQLNNGDLASAVATISTSPITADGEVLKGLIRRRKEEGALFST